MEAFQNLAELYSSSSSDSDSSLHSVQVADNQNDPVRQLENKLISALTESDNVWQIVSEKQIVISRLRAEVSH